MTLSFSKKTKTDESTFFVEKILLSITMYLTHVSNADLMPFIRDSSTMLGYVNYIFLKRKIALQKPKIHTIRHDSKNRWREGMDIHFVINNRTKDRFQFAPILKVQCIQKFQIRWYKDEHGKKQPIARIDDKLFAKNIDDDNWTRLAHNDGFPDAHSFLQWFHEDFDGKIIHWTQFDY